MRARVHFYEGEPVMNHIFKIFHSIFTVKNHTPNSTLITEVLSYYGMEKMEMVMGGLRIS